MSDKSLMDYECECGHKFKNHDFKVKEGMVLFGRCKKCKCVDFKCEELKGKN